MKRLTRLEAWNEIYHAIRVTGELPTDGYYHNEKNDGLCSVLNDMILSNLISARTRKQMGADLRKYGPPENRDGYRWPRYTVPPRGAFALSMVKRLEKEGA